MAEASRAAVHRVDEHVARDGTRLHVAIDAPADARAGVVIHHGFAEHGGRYDEVVARLNAAGVATLRFDARGHGRSTGRRGHVDHFSQYLTDLAEMLDVARDALPRPLALLGHSQGGLVALRYLLDAPGAVDGLIVSNPALVVRAAVPGWKKVAGRVFSRAWPTLAVPTGLPPDSISRDPAEVAAYADDPLIFKVGSARWYTEFVDAQQAVLAAPGRLRTAPLLGLLGMGDPLIDATASDRFLQGVAADPVTVHRYDGLYHELVREIRADRERVFADLLGWLGALQADGR
jgi:alpha-beta hydrolase superfamily lysophospholipase